MTKKPMACGIDVIIAVVVFVVRPSNLNPKPKPKNFNSVAMNHNLFMLALLKIFSTEDSLILSRKCGTVNISFISIKMHR